VNNFDVFETRLIANRTIANNAVGYATTADLELAWHVLDNVLPYIESLEANIEKLAYTLEVLNEQANAPQQVAE